MDRRFEPDGRTNRERMLAGDAYLAQGPDLHRDAIRAEQLTAAFNATGEGEPAQRLHILRELFDHVGDNVVIRPPLRCDYGYQTRIGARSFVNWGLICLDVGRITIGEDVLIGPNVQLLTATHPIEPGPRRAKWEGSDPITIHDNAWLGGGVIVCPGVTIGKNTVVGAGAVVTRDLPANVVAAGNPAQVIRSIQDSSNKHDPRQ